MNVKTNWVDGDNFTYSDWNRLRANCLELKNKFGITLPVIDSVVANREVYDRDLNQLSNWVRYVADFLYGDRVPTDYFRPPLYGIDAPVWNARVINGIERDLQIFFDKELSEVTYFTGSGLIITTDNYERITIQI